MQLTIRDIGKTFTYSTCPDLFELEGFERHGEELYAVGIGPGRGGCRPGKNDPTKLYYLLSYSGNDEFTSDFFPVDRKLAKEPYFNFARFGCNENHVRDLIKVLDERYVHKEK